LQTTPTINAATDGTVTIGPTGSTVTHTINGFIPANKIKKSIVRYTSASGQSIPNNTATVVDFATLVFDTKSEVTTGASWRFTAQETGYYHVDARIMFTNVSTWASTEDAVFIIQKNGAFYSELHREIDHTSVIQYVNLGGSDLVQLNAGQYIDIVITQQSGAALALIADGRYNFVSIEQVN
jgi:hypothetical protein